MLVFDDIFVQRWHVAVNRCKGRLDRHDWARVEKTTDIAQAKQQIESLQHDFPSNAATPELTMLTPGFAQLEIFSTTFYESLQQRVDPSTLWGLLVLVLKLAIESESALFRLARMLKVIGHKAELFNGYSKHANTPNQIQEIALDVHVELVEFFSKVVAFFRNDFLDLSDDEPWRPLVREYKVAIQGVEEAFERIERLSQMTKTQTHLDELTKLQNLLLLSSTQEEEARLPCIVLPTVSISKFFDRDPIMAKIDEHFFTDTENITEVRSIALYGLGGVGKSQTALKYAYKEKTQLDAILWMRSETPAAIAQSFTEAALALGLQDAKPQQHTGNRVLVLSWLQRTQSSWLIIFDNAEDPNVLLEYWPVASRGSVIITARNPSFAFDPAERGIEIPHFNPEEGSGFLLHLLRVDVIKALNASETDSALELSHLLGGHALAISQMAGLIHLRSWSIKDFVKVYEENARKMHTSSRPGNVGLDTVWKLSFESLSPSAAALLGVLSLLMPDKIPQSLFEVPLGGGLPKSLAFCADGFEFSEVIEPLLTLALIKRDKETRDISLHRLVQQQFRYQMKHDDAQKSFEETAQLLDSVFPPKPKVSGQMYNVWEKCRKYLQHVLSLADHYKRDSLGPDGLRPTLPFIRVLTHCSRYLLETGSYVELATILDIAHGAYNAWEGRQNDPMLLITILLPMGTQWLHRGDFELSEKYNQQVLDICHKHAPEDTDALISPLNNIGNATASAGKIDKAVEWFEKLAEIDTVDDGLAPDALTQCNLGRAYDYAGRTEEAKTLYLSALDSFEKSENWAMLAFTRFALGNFYRKAGDLDTSYENFETARKTWTEHDIAPTHLFHGACMYKLGCVPLDRGEINNSISHLEKAVAIAQVQKNQLEGEYARAVWKLSVAVRPGARNDSPHSKAAADADMIATDIPQALSVVDPVDEATYDNLICWLWR